MEEVEELQHDVLRGERGELYNLFAAYFSCFRLFENRDGLKDLKIANSFDIVQMFFLRFALCPCRICFFT